jgi:hypothetical protein
VARDFVYLAVSSTDWGMLSWRRVNHEGAHSASRTSGGKASGNRKPEIFNGPVPCPTAWKRGHKEVSVVPTRYISLFGPMAERTAHLSEQG